MHSARRPTGGCLSALAACLLLLLAHAGPTAAEVDEAVIMTDLRDLLRREAPGWAHRTEGWGIGRTSHHCSWEGVTCKAGHVTQLHISLEGNHRLISESAWRGGKLEPHTGVAPRAAAQLAALPHLTTLMVKWPGAPWGVPLPPQWVQAGSFPGLQWLEWAVDTLPGALPLPDIQPGALPALRSTVLTFLNLTSTLPGSWGGSPDVLPALDELRLIVGDITGSLPAGWADGGGFRRLENLVLGCLQGVNARDGVPLERRAAAAAAAAAASVPPATLPPSWGGGAFPALTSLTMHGLPVGGTFPASWLTPGAFPKLKSLGMHRMDVLGTLPERLFEANPSLTDAAFDECLFSGTLPARWGDSAADIISLDGNNLSGPAFPASWLEGYMPRLLFLSLSDNSRLTGTLPATLTWPRLRTLAVDGTGVTGSVPKTWCNQPTELALLYAGGTTIDPTVPGCKHLAYLHVNMRPATEPLHFGSMNDTLFEHWRAPGQPQPSMTNVGLATGLPLGVLATAGFAARLLLQRRRRRHLREALEQQQLLAGPPSFHASAASATGGGSTEGWRRGSPSASSILVKAAPRRRLAALLAEQLREGGQLELEAVPAAAALPHAIMHRLAPSDASVGPVPGQASSVELSSLRLGLSQQSAHAVQQWLASSSAAGEPSPGVGPSGSTPPLMGSCGSRQPAGSFDPASRLSSLPWGLPTESIRMPASAMTFVLGKDGGLVELGSGTHATVFLARLRRREEPPAQAQLVLEVEAGVDSAAVWREVAMMRRCQHSRIVQLLGVTLKGPLLMIAMELKAGSLRAALDGSKPLGDLRWAAMGRQVALDMAEGLDQLHTRHGILHSDLKPANVLLAADGRACLSDLGLAQALGAGIRTAAGFSRLYAAPEQLMGQRCGLAADVYSFGLLLVSLLTRQLMRERGSWRLPRAPEECPREVASLIEECLSADPAARPTAAQILARLQAAAS
ncbi:hypothetical protein ABPG77_004082 [Micractinium sp. CCAP 211/92]